MSAAEQSGSPVLFGATRTSALPLAEQLKLLRTGDVMTYCFHQGGGSIMEDGRVLDCVWDARERCVLFDVGDGANALGFEVAEVAIAEGFLPDALSSEHYQHHFLPEPDHDLPQVVSKMIAAGMTAEQYWSRVTSVLAQVLGLGSEIRTASADLRPHNLYHSLC